jgi:hypothetical protein
MKVVSSFKFQVASFVSAENFSTVTPCERRFGGHRPPLQFFLRIDLSANGG